MVRTAWSERTTTKRQPRMNGTLSSALSVGLMVFALGVSGAGTSAAASDEATGEANRQEAPRWVYTQAPKYCRDVCQSKEDDNLVAVRSPKDFYAVCAVTLELRTGEISERPGYQFDSPRLQEKTCHTGWNKKDTSATSCCNGSS